MPKTSDSHLAARRQQILDAATECFAREGVHRTTVQHIVAEAGVSAGLFYRHFDSKEAIVEAIADERHAREESWLREAAADPDAEQALQHLVGHFFYALADPAQLRHRRVGVQVWAEALRSPRILRIARRGVDMPVDALAELIRGGQGRGEIPAEVDPDAAARVMVAVFHGFVLQLAWDVKMDIEAFVRAMEDAWDGLLRLPKR